MSCFYEGQQSLDFSGEQVERNSSFDKSNETARSGIPLMERRLKEQVLDYYDEVGDEGNEDRSSFLNRSMEENEGLSKSSSNNNSLVQELNRERLKRLQEESLSRSSSRRAGYIPGQLSRPPSDTSNPSGNANQSIPNETLEVVPITWGFKQEVASNINTTISPNEIDEQALADVLNHVIADRDIKGQESVNRRVPESKKISINSVPTGTRLSVVLAGNVVSSSLKQRVWAITAQEVTFRRQTQLPKGVMIGGYASETPVRNLLDIEFDIMVFPDGTELSFNGFAVNANNPMYPGLEGIRGLVGKYVEPPLWTEVLPLLTSFAVGYSDQVFTPNTVIAADGGGRRIDPTEQLMRGANEVTRHLEGKIAGIWSDIRLMSAYQKE